MTALPDILIPSVCCKWPHVRPCGPSYDEAVCACGCTGYDERCGTYTSNHPDDAGVTEGVIKGLERSPFETFVDEKVDSLPTFNPLYMTSRRALADLLRRFEHPRSYAGDYCGDFADRVMKILLNELGWTPLGNFP